MDLLYSGTFAKSQLRAFWSLQRTYYVIGAAVKLLMLYYVRLLRDTYCDDGMEQCLVGKSVFFVLSFAVRIAILLLRGFALHQASVTSVIITCSRVCCSCDCLTLTCSNLKHHISVHVYVLLGVNSL